MKKNIIPLFIIPVCLLLLAGNMAYLAEFHPFSADDVPYALQLSAEQARFRLAATPSQRVSYAIELAERRLADLGQAELFTAVEKCASEAARNLVQAVDAYQAAAPEIQDGLYEPLLKLIEQAGLFMAYTPETANPGLQALHEALLNLNLSQGTHQDLASRPAAGLAEHRITAERVSFLGKEVDHGDFSLDGGHSGLECSACHPSGVYKNSPNQCSDCHFSPLQSISPSHVQPEKMYLEPIYPNHFSGECSDCHTVASWEASEFDHRQVLECQSCHTEDLPQSDGIVQTQETIWVAYPLYFETQKPSPPEHYPGDCLICHPDTQDWAIREYEHAGVQECSSCHAWETPQPHLPGDCQACHANVMDWLEASVNHDNYNACLDCHLEDDPQEHYAGLCSGCHTTEAWSQAVFSHAGFTDCRSCHIQPEGHYSGQCSSCHDQASWIAVDFKHKDFGECVKCHKEDWPSSNHYVNACANCHVLTGWSTLQFTHSSGSDCQQCHRAAASHYGGQCSNCHNLTRWSQVSMDHTGLGDCAACHQAPLEHYAETCQGCHNVNAWEDAAFIHPVSCVCLDCHQADTPANHYGGDCANCHNTTSWGNYTFSHVNLVDCQVCHTAAGEHYPGQCSNCHTTSRWGDIVFNHSGYDACSDCHSKDGHWPGECSNCHTTQDWSDISFDHTGYTNCNSCHNTDRPSSHPRGQCSNCHTTETWVLGTPTVEPAMILPLTTPEPPSSRGSGTDQENSDPQVATPPSQRE